MIENERCAIVTAHPGSGKSGIIHHIAMKNRKRGWVVKPVETIHQIIKAYESNDFVENMTLFVINDPIGNEVLEEILHCSWTKYEKTIEHILTESETSHDLQKIDFV